MRSGHVHQDKPDAPICSDFLLGKCKKGVRCSGHHCSLPFHWQYKVPDVDEWKSFTETDNETLEKLYCDVMLEDCSASGFQISFERQVAFDSSRYACALSNGDGDGKINLIDSIS